MAETINKFFFLPVLGWLTAAKLVPLLSLEHSWLRCRFYTDHQLGWAGLSTSERWIVKKRDRERERGSALPVWIVPQQWKLLSRSNRVQVGKNGIYTHAFHRRHRHLPVFFFFLSLFPDSFSSSSSNLFLLLFAIRMEEGTKEWPQEGTVCVVVEKERKKKALLLFIKVVPAGKSRYYRSSSSSPTKLFFFLLLLLLLLVGLEGTHTQDPPPF